VSTVVSAIVARVVAGVHTASTVVSAMFARSAVGQESASMVVSAEMQGVRVEQMTTVVTSRVVY
jgi:hypothetical protein